MTMAYHLLCLCSLLPWQAISGQPFPSQQRMEEWVDNFDVEIHKLTSGDNDLTLATQLEKAYQRAFDDGVGFSIEKPDGVEIAQDMRDKIEAIFEKNIEALQSLHESAEKLVREYQYDQALSLSQVPYTNVNEMDKLLNLTEYSDHFKQYIYPETSGVQIPIELYEGYNSMQMTRVCPQCVSICDLCQNNLYWRQDSSLGLTDVPLVKDPDILNSIAWTQALDETFKANMQRYPGIYWQSFGSQEGILRMYPASQWQTVDDLPDLFDVRRRPWYIQGTSSPKDMVILLDTSGSMHGQSFDIMKIAAKTLLNTLGENDYVNVAAFSRDVSWVTPCLGPNLVQANARNKRLLFDGIDQLEDRYIASFRDALQYAYTKLENFDAQRDQHEGSNCHKLIMIFSDGGTENPSKILQVYTNSSRGIISQTRIFTYAVGPHPLPTVALKDMACSTGGAFTTITAMGAIRTKVQGLGFATTITMPVFNTSAHSDNQTLAGVIGIDIPISRFEAFAPRNQLGPLGKSFAVNENGFLIFHPSLWTVSNYLEDPAHNDLEDIEGDSEAISSLRKAMIDLATSQDQRAEVQRLTIPDSSVILNEGHSKSLNMSFYFTSVPKTRFALAVVLPEFWQYIQVPEQIDAPDILNRMLKEDQILLSRSRKYCDETKANEDEDPESIEVLLEKMKHGACHGRDLNHLIWDYKTLKEQVDKKGKEEMRKNFVLTDGGLQLHPDPDSKVKLRQDSVLHLDAYNSSLYKQAVLSPTPVVYIQKFVDRHIVPTYVHSSHLEADDDLLVSDEEDDDLTTSPSSSSTTTTSPPEFVMQTSPPAMYLSKSVKLWQNDKSKRKETTVAVSGVELTAEFWQGLLYNTTECGKMGGDNLFCYLIDTSAYVLASNRKDKEVQAGDFLGRVDSQIMDHFVQKGFFRNQSEYNYQALCPTQIDCKTENAAPKVVVFNLIHGLVNILKDLSVLMYALTGLFPGMAYAGTSEYTKQVTEGLHRCTTQTRHWEWKDEIERHVGSLDITCQGMHYKRDVYAYKLQKLNAILVFAEPMLYHTCKIPLVFDGPLEVPSDEQCVLPKRYRSRPEDCFAVHDDEVFECKNVATLPAAALLSSTLLVVLMVTLTN